jgi:hypothetical protein
VYGAPLAVKLVGNQFFAAQKRCVAIGFDPPPTGPFGNLEEAGSCVFITDCAKPAYAELQITRPPNRNKGPFKMELQVQGSLGAIRLGVIDSSILPSYFLCGLAGNLLDL